MRTLSGSTELRQAVAGDFGPNDVRLMQGLAEQVSGLRPEL
jgi:hypothetical protein